MLKHGIAGHFPFIVGFPDESDASIQATLECAKRLRSLSPDFLTPIYYFKPYPGSELVHRGGSARLSPAARHSRRGPNSTTWPVCPGPWVSPEKFQLIERFKFFQELAWKRVSRGKRLLQQLARYRCSTRRLSLAASKCC